MERVETLCNLLNEKLQKKASVNEMLDTVRMLESELIHLKNITPPETDINSNASLKISKLFEKETSPEVTTEPAGEEEKIVEVLQIDEADVEAELEEIKKTAAEINHLSHHAKPALIFDPMEDIPTLAGRKSFTENADVLPAKEIHEQIPVIKTLSQNGLFQKPEKEPELPEGSPVKDLKKAITADERHNYINELFRGDEAMYERSIKTINGFAIYPEAEYWIRRELKLKLGWSDKNEVVRLFDQLVRRRFA